MKLFIIGISGRLGLNIALQLREQFQVGGSYLSHPVVTDGVQSFKLDATNAYELELALTEIRPDIVLNAIGITNVDSCEADPTLAYKINVETAQNCGKIAAALGSRLIHISTDHLFDGLTPWRTEADQPTPLNVYAKTKWQAEQVVLQTCPKALIIRTNFFGWGTSIRPSFSDWIWQGLVEQRELTMFSDAFFTPILMNDLVEVIVKLLQIEATGVFHVGGERLSKYAFALQLAEVFGYSTENIYPVSIEGFPFKAQRPKDMSLSGKKTEKLLQISMPTAKAGLERLKDLYAQGWSQTLESAVKSEQVEGLK